MAPYKDLSLQLKCCGPVSGNVGQLPPHGDTFRSEAAQSLAVVPQNKGNIHPVIVSPALSLEEVPGKADCLPSRKR